MLFGKIIHCPEHEEEGVMAMIEHVQQFATSGVKISKPLPVPVGHDAILIQSDDPGKMETAFRQVAAELPSGWRCKVEEVVNPY